MTDKKTQKQALKLALYNDMLETCLHEIKEEGTGLETEIKDLKKASANLTRAIDNIMGRETAEIFSELYGQVNEVINDVSDRIICI